MWRLNFGLLFLLAGCASPYAVPDAATAIAIGKTQCNLHNPKSWHAELVGDTWTVHASISLGLFGEMTMQVTREGVITPGCQMVFKPGLGKIWS